MLKCIIVGFHFDVCMFILYTFLCMVELVLACFYEVCVMMVDPTTTMVMALESKFPLSEVVNAMFIVYHTFGRRRAVKTSFLTTSLLSPLHGP